MLCQAIHSNLWFHTLYIPAAEFIPLTFIILVQLIFLDGFSLITLCHVALVFFKTIKKYLEEKALDTAD